jgi:hypothetical protein
MEQEEEIEYNTREQYITSACEAFYAVTQANPMTKEETILINEIKEKSLKIIGFYLLEMYQEVFPEDSCLIISSIIFSSIIF